MKGQIRYFDMAYGHYSWNVYPVSREPFAFGHMSTILHVVEFDFLGQ